MRRRLSLTLLLLALVAGCHQQPLVDPEKIVAAYGLEQELVPIPADDWRVTVLHDLPSYSNHILILRVQSPKPGKLEVIRDSVAFGKGQELGSASLAPGPDGAYCATVKVLVFQSKSGSTYQQPTSAYNGWEISVIAGGRAVSTQAQEGHRADTKPLEKELKVLSTSGDSTRGATRPVFNFENQTFSITVK